MDERNCETCGHMVAESKDENGNRIVDCEANEWQLYAPYAEECKHWVPRRDDRSAE